MNNILDDSDDDIIENSYHLGLPMLWYMGNKSHWLVFDIISKNEFYEAKVTNISSEIK